MPTDVPLRAEFEPQPTETELPVPCARRPIEVARLAACDALPKATEPSPFAEDPCPTATPKFEASAAIHRDRNVWLRNS